MDKVTIECSKIYLNITINAEHYGTWIFNSRAAMVQALRKLADEIERGGGKNERPQK